MERIRFGMLMGLLCAAALVLLGCGGSGGGDDGVRQDLEAQVEALTGERDAALQAQKAAEAARKAAGEAQTVAEAARKAAAAARAAAEGERDAAKTAQLEAEAVEAEALADLAEAEAAQKAAEAARATAEEARATADAARKAAEEARATAETERDAAKAAQAEAVVAQAEAVAAQAEAEAAQAESVAAEMAAKAAQTAAEAARDAAVKAKTAAEAARDESRDGETQAKIDLIAAQSAQALAERERDRANAAKTEAEQAQAAAETARQEAETARTAAETARNAALEEKTQAEEALAAARSKAEQDLDAASTKAGADIAELQSQLDDANTKLEAAQDQLGEANTKLAAAETARDAALEDKRDAETALQVANARLEEVRRQLGQARDDLTDAEREARAAEAEANRRIAEAEQQADVSTRAPNLLAELVATPLPEVMEGMGSVTVSHEPGERSATFKPTTAATRGSAAPSVPGTWNHRASFSSTVGVTATDTFYLYSNIERPAKRKFWQVYGVDVLVESGNDDMARLTGSRRLRVTDDMDTSNILTDDSVRVTYSGRFDGANGTFSCTGTGRDECKLTNAATVAEGLTIDNGAWTFAPSSLNNPVGADMQDDTYLYFGIWAREPKEASDTTNLDFRWIADGDSRDITTANFGDLEGTATFNGGAVGKYALKAVAGREARIGTFTAKATFTASFDEDTLSGTIDEFREGGSSLGAGWRISLIENATDTGADLTASGANGEAHGSIGGVDAEGDWAATLHGSDNMILTPREDATITYPKSRYPAANLAGVVGWFNAFDGADAAASNAAIAGAFGAACTSGAACGK